MLNRKCILTIAAIVGFLASAAGATSLAVPNFSFEDPAQGDGNNSRTFYPAYPTITSWTPFTSGHVGGNDPHVGLWDPSGAGPTGLTGLQYARVYMSEVDSQGGEYTTLTSDVLGQTLSGYTYTVTADFMDPSAWGTGGSELQILAAGSKASGASISASSSAFTPTTLSWDCTTAGQDIEVRVWIGGSGRPLKIDIDNVRVDYAPTAADLTIKKFFDCNGDDTYNGEDIYLSNWQFNVSNTAYGGSYDQNHTTDANGEINLTGLTPGDYDVTETMKGTGWVVSGANPRMVAVSGTTEVGFGNQLPGDANQDEKVNLSDFTVLKAYFGEDPSGWTDGNFNTDTTVNLADFTILKANFGLGAPSAGGVPEPATMGLLALGAAALLRRRRR